MLQKQSLKINFARGLDTKTDPLQVEADKFLSLQNSIFTKQGLLQKRNGFKQLLTLPLPASYLSTFAGNLAAIGKNIQIFSKDSNQWLNRGNVQPCSLSVLPAVRTSTSQTVCDVSVAPNGLACCVYESGIISHADYYQIIDSETGQIIVSQTALPVTATQCRVFSVGNYFIITFLATVSSTTHLQYISIPLNTPGSPSSATDISTSVHGLSAGYDGYSFGGNFFISWSGSDVGGAIRSTSPAPTKRSTRNCRAALLT
jgi:hypothetical protein